MKDADGNTLSIDESVWYDDGTSPDWVQGTVVNFTTVGSVVIQPAGGGNVVPVQPPLIHVNKPTNPPDR